VGYRELTPEEQKVVVNRGTEPPFSGRYCEFFDRGVYLCRRCGRPLYLSEHKFPCSCGWASFDDEIPGAVIRRPDPDGHRTEITCAGCAGHLGHVFQGERLTVKNVRHCVNSLSLTFVPKEDLKRGLFAGGCFWGIQHIMKDLPGVVHSTCGYCGGTVDYPSYEQVCSGETGHLETVEVLFDPEKISYRDLTRYFLEIHDPTQKGGQGPDLGDQYRSAIFAVDEEQRKAAEELLDELRDKGLEPVTEIRPEARFWPAEPLHQHYYLRTGSAPYCHRRVARF